PSRLNPLLSTDSASSAISGYLFTGLVKYDVNATIVGDLAETFRFIDPTHVEFILRKNAKWHDGKAFSAADVKFTYDLLKSKKISTPFAHEFRKVEKVDVINDHKLIVTYKSPYYKALEIWMMGIVPKHLLENEKEMMTSTFNQNPIGTGPYKLKTFELSKSVELIANADYYEHKPNIGTIYFSIVPEAPTRFYMLRKHEIDLAGLTPLQIAKKVKKSFTDYYRIIEQPAKAYTYLGFNFGRKIFQDKRVRKAITLGIDKNEIVDILFFKHGQPCHGPFLPGTFAYNKAYEKNIYNPKEAKRLLKEAGYSKEKPLVFELLTNTGNPTRLAAAQIVLHQLSKIGVVVKLRLMEWQAFLNTRVFPKDFDAVVLGWGLSLVPDAYSMWHSDGIKSGGFNLNDYNNTSVDKLIVEAETITNRDKLSKVYQKIFSTIVDDYPYVFLYIPNEITAINKKIKPVIKSIVGLEHNQIDWVKE
ncbi:MAG: peptide-binding protein, partial [Thiovulaceae bacterium]|nr:peptide-binding protein [Sulfurimonadaceae bacterium]